MKNKMKKLLVMLFSILVLISTAQAVMASSVPTVSYDGGSYLNYTDENGNAISGNSSFGTAFSAMLPGVTYTQSINLANNDKNDTVRYYMDLNVIRTLQAAGLDGAGYTVELLSTDETLYSSKNGVSSGVLVGGSGSGGELADLNESMYNSDGKGILVATLKPGDTTEISLNITADATMSNAYQAATGTLSFQFFGEVVPTPKDTNTVVTKVKTVYVRNGVQTGDTSPVFIVAGILVVALVVFLAVSFVGKKRGKEDKRSS